MQNELIPTYSLYGEGPENPGTFRIHCESIAARSQLFSWEIKPHRHKTFFQILYLRDGHGDALFGETEHRIVPQTIITVPQETVHGFRFSKDMDGFVLTCVADQMPLKDAMHSRRLPGLDRPGLFYLKSGTGNGQDRFPFPVAERQTPAGHHGIEAPDWAFLVTTLGKIESELNAGFATGMELVESCLASALIMLSRLTGEAGSSDMASRDMIRVQKLNELIGLHFRAHHPVAFYAREIGVSEHHLNRITRAATQCTVNRLILNRLMEEARRDLLFTTMSIQQITFDLGYSDPAYFSRLFSDQTGVSPSEYRLRERAKLEQFR